MPLNRLPAEAVHEPVTIADAVEVALTLSWPDGRSGVVSGLVSAWTDAAVFVTYEGGLLGWFPPGAVTRSG